jgi:hypothetical protein
MIAEICLCGKGVVVVGPFGGLGADREDRTATGASGAVEDRRRNGPAKTPGLLWGMSAVPT